MAVLLANNATSRLASSLTAAATTLSVTTGEGAKFPSPTGGDWFPLTLIKSSGALEILRCTARSGDVFTVTRAQEGTAAQAFSAGDRVEVRLTKAVMDAIVQQINDLNNFAVQQINDLRNSALLDANNLSDLTNAATARTNLGLGTAATANLTTSSVDGTVGRVLKVGDGGWMSRGEVQQTPYGYPSSVTDVTNQTKVIRSESTDNGVGPFTSGIHFAAADTWGRLRVGFITAGAWVQGGIAGNGTGWTSQVVLTDNLLQTTGSSTTLPMSQAAVTNAINNNSIGVGQTWQDVTASRASGTTYTNTTGKPISVIYTTPTRTNTNDSLVATVSGVVVRRDQNGTNFQFRLSAEFTVPPGATYSITTSLGGAGIWVELR